MDILKDFGEPRIKQVMLPKDTNSAGNIFGGWIMSQIDLAGAQAAREISPERVVTISMKEIIFKTTSLCWRRAKLLCKDHRSWQNIDNNADRSDCT